MSLRAQVLNALDEVHDPELDEPITVLGFVGSCVVSHDGDVDLRLRLPTPQCAPNFAFLMVFDARSAVAGVPGVGRVAVVLEDHYTGAEITAAVDHGAGFDGAFPGETTGDVAVLRELFHRKALVGRQARVAQALLAGGCSEAETTALRVRDLPASAESARCLQLRRVLGLRHDEDAPAIVAGDGSAIPAGQLRTWLRRARLMSLSLESNGGICRDLLRARHGAPDTEEVAA